MRMTHRKFDSLLRPELKELHADLNLLARHWRQFTRRGTPADVIDFLADAIAAVQTKTDDPSDDTLEHAQEVVTRVIVAWEDRMRPRPLREVR